MKYKMPFDSIESIVNPEWDKNNIDFTDEEFDNWINELSQKGILDADKELNSLAKELETIEWEVETLFINELTERYLSIQLKWKDEITESDYFIIKLFEQTWAKISIEQVENVDTEKKKEFFNEINLLYYNTSEQWFKIAIWKFKFNNIIEPYWMLERLDKQKNKWTIHKLIGSF